MIRTGTCTLLQLWYPNMNNCLSRVRGWWVRGQRRGQALQTSRALQMTDRRGVWSQWGGASSHFTWPRETQHHRSESDTLNTPVILASAFTTRHASSSRFPLSHPPLFILSCCTDMFYIDVRHVGWPHPSSNGAQWFVDRRWTGAVTDCGGIKGGGLL